MAKRFLPALFVVAVIAGAAWLATTPTEGQTQAARPGRTADGKPDMNGIWQAMNSANWDIQDHAAKQGPIVALGAAFSVPAGQGIVVGNEIAYLPAAAAKKKENGDNWVKLDPEVKCYMPGVPRANYQPYPFQIVQTPTHWLMAYEFASASRIIYVNGKDEAPVDSWMGHSNARWDGDTFVVEVTGNNDQTWFDRAGNHHSDALKVTERYTMTDRNTINYEATLEDPKTFSKPFKIQMPLYRRQERNAQLLEYKCVEFVEELMYGHLRKKSE